MFTYVSYKELEEFLGEEMWEKMKMRFGGCQIGIPKPDKERKYKNREKYYKYFEQGIPFQEICNINGVKIDRVRKAFRVWRENDKKANPQDYIQISDI